MKYRITAKGLLKQNSKILFAEYEINKEVFYALPGGEQNVGESLVECLKREFKEEANIEVVVGKLLLINEFILSDPPSHTVESWEKGIHQIENIFEVATLPEDQFAQTGTLVDFGMSRLKWLSLDEMKEIKFYPERSLEWFFNTNNDREGIYTIKKPVTTMSKKS
ncbi:MAG: NUDIX domain-containing protein [Bacteroidia bacterium]|nr:NUDIX domain-containing protein [Bacteroidia bacterium]